MSNKSRAQNLLESFDDVITGLMTQMDSYAKESGGYMNRMHPDQFDHDGNKRADLLSENRRQKKQRRTLGTRRSTQ